MTDPRKAVHRLIEIVVEEVSLVDRAANKHRFLIVKRDEGETDHTMEDLTEPNDDDTDLDPDEGSPEDKTNPGSVLDVATKALSALTDAVERIGAGGEGKDEVTKMASELRAAADDLAKLVGAEPAPKPGDEGGDSLEQIRDSLAQVRELLSNAPSAPPPKEPTTEEPPTPTTKSEGSADTKKLDALLAQMATLGKGLAEQRQKLGQRLAQLEKHFGVPNSSPAGEQTGAPKDEEGDDGWSFDLNNPLDRENVDKSVSFHDL